MHCIDLGSLKVFYPYLSFILKQVDSLLAAVTCEELRAQNIITFTLLFNALPPHNLEN